MGFVFGMGIDGGGVDELFGVGSFGSEGEVEVFS